MKVLVACESSGTVREAFRRMGHDAWSCDLLPADDKSQYHIQDDVLNIIQKPWDLVIAHPPCTYLCGSGIHWLKARKKNTIELQEKEIRRVEKRKADTEIAKSFFMQFTKLKCKWCIENPIGIMSRHYRKPNQIIQPYQFGHNASKRTCLWLNGLPALTHTAYVEPRLVKNKGKVRKRWDNQTDSGQNKLAPSKDRWKIRSKTYEGVADAMAKQWSKEVKF
jgi:hypothetical protein